MSKHEDIYTANETFLYLLSLLSFGFFLSLSEFIDPSASHMVNLSATAFEEASKDVENPSRYAFSAAQVSQPAGLCMISDIPQEVIKLIEILFLS